MLKVTKVSKSYNSGVGPVPVIRDLDLAVMSGEILGVAGPSGAGKTSLARLLAGLEALDSGSIEIGGGAAGDKSVCVSLMRQETALLPWMSTVWNVALPLFMKGENSARESKRIAGNWLEDLGLGKTQDQRVSLLSGGMKQRVAFAAATIVRPQLLILDEPTSALDDGSRSKLLGLLQNHLAREDSCAVLISHDIDFLSSVSQRILHLEGPDLGGTWNL